MSDAGRAARRARVGRTGARFPAFVEFDEDPGEVGIPDAPASGAGPDDAMVGRTGARFNSRARAVHRTARRVAARDAVARAARGDAAEDLTRPALLVAAADDPATMPILVPVTVPDAEDPDPDDRVWVRPYVRTQGRTRSRTVLAVETLVSVRSPHPAITDPEHLAIAAVCVAPRSVAEVAARAGVPLGVARVLIDDMATIGLLAVHELAVERSGAPRIEVLARVLDGLHRL